MGKASSAKKVARLAERGKGKKARFQGGTVFPIVVGVVVVLGLMLIAYSRNTSRSDAAGPQIGSHWHESYGIYLCDKYLEPFQDNKESTPEYQEVQIHSHGDGVMHWHPGNEQAINRSTGRKATFDVFLKLYGVDLTDDKMTISGAELTPPTADQVFEEGVTKCTVDGKEVDGSLRVIVWDRYDLPNARTVSVSRLGDQRIAEDQQVFVVAFVPDSVQNSDIPLPSWAADLPTLAAVDTPGATPTTIPGAATTVASPSPAAATDTPPTVAAPTTLG